VGLVVKDLLAVAIDDGLVFSYRHRIPPSA
jgi:hypothetical protein